MKTRIKHWLAGVVAAAGLLLGPAYLAYCWYLTGSAAGTYQLRMQQPVTLKLSPDMNPIRFTVAATFDFASTSAVDDNYDYRAVLAKGGQTMWEELFSVTRSSNTGEARDKGFQIRFGPHSAEIMSPLRTFSVDRPGEFTLTIRPEPDEFATRVGVNLYLHVRRNVVSPKLAIVIPGFLLAVIGALGWLVTKQPGSKRRRATRFSRQKRSRVAVATKQSQSHAAAPPQKPAARAPTERDSLPNPLAANALRRRPERAASAAGGVV